MALQLWALVRLVQAIGSFFLPPVAKMSTAQAVGYGAANLAAEAPGWDFDAVRDSAAATWREALASIELEAARDTSSLPERTTARAALDDLLVRLRVDGLAGGSG